MEKLTSKAVYFSINNDSVSKFKYYTTPVSNNTLCNIHCIYISSKNLVVYYCKCCNLIGYATCYLFINTVDIE